MNRSAALMVSFGDRHPRIRLVLTPADHRTGERRPGDVYVYTWPLRRHATMMRRFARCNRGSRVLTTPEGFHRYHAHLMDEEYYRDHPPGGRAVHLGQVHGAFAPRECPEKQSQPSGEVTTHEESTP